MQKRSTLDDNALIILAYRRPEMTAEAVQRATSFDPSLKIFVSIDGLRSGADSQEKYWRSETLLSVQSFETTANVEILNWRENLGLVDHSMRAQELAFRSCSRVIILEEDMVLSQEGYQFLVENTSTGALPSISCAYTKFNHSDSQRLWRLTFFPNLWGVAINKAFFGALKDTLRSRRVEPAVVPPAFGTLGRLSKRLQERGVRYWETLFWKAIESDYHMDAIMMYTAMRVKVPWRVPPVSYLTDIGHLDSRGTNPRTEDDKEKTECKELETAYCQICDRASARFRLFKGGRYWYGAMYGALRSRLPVVLVPFAKMKAAVASIKSRN